MAEEKQGGAPQPPKMKECTRLQAAYETMKADPKAENYIAMLQALEADLRDDASAYLPVATQEDVETLQKTGQVKWMALETPKGRMLSFFTTAAQSAKKGAVANIAISIQAFFKLLTDNKEIAGFVVNPFDDQHGFLLDRKNLEIVLARAKGVKVEVPRLEMPLVLKAVERLFGCAVGVPTPVYEAEAEMKTLGGPDVIMRPLQEKWQKAMQDGSFKPANPVEYVKTIVKDAMTQAFVAGALIRRGVDMVRDADPNDCIERVPYLKDDLGQNTDEYLVCLSETLRQDLKLTDENVLWATQANNIGVVAFGAVCFGFGWGLAKCCESEGKESLAELKQRQVAFRARTSG